MVEDGVEPPVPTPVVGPAGNGAGDHGTIPIADLRRGYRVGPALTDPLARPCLVKVGDVWAQHDAVDGGGSAGLDCPGAGRQTPAPPAGRLGRRESA